MTVPSNVRFGNASTVKLALLPSLMPPMSLSLTLVSTCILVRSVAIRNSVGVWKLAATVWPTGDVARHDGAVHRRNDVGVVEIDLRGGELRLALLDRGLVDADLRLRLVEAFLALSSVSWETALVCASRALRS